MKFARHTLALLLLVTCGWVSTGAAAEPTAWPMPEWSVAKPETQQMSSAGLDRVGQWLKEHGSKTGLVVRHGRIVGEWYFDDATQSTPYLVYSTSKSFASTAAHLAIADGKLTLDSKVGEFVPDVKPEAKRNITVRQIISMDTGVHNNKDLHNMDKLFSYAMYEAPLDFEPAAKWDYNNTGLALLAPVLKKATGQEVDQILEQKLFGKIGIARGDWTWEQREGRSLPYSGLHITARSLARFGLLFLNEGRWQDQQLVSTAWVKEATGPSQELNKSYGYLWWNNTTGKWKGVPADAYAALGRFDNSMLVVPSLDLVVLRQVGDDTAGNHKMDIGELWRLACEACTDAK
ncbi:MAG: serine hydrolase [Planctomycetes bacterium]|nr:serine hydrolase [Planctomycetota bacterium]